MRVIQKRKGKGKTTKLLKRTLHLVKRGYDVIFISCSGMLYSLRVMETFSQLLERKRIPYRRFVEKNYVKLPHGTVHFISLNEYKQKTISYYMGIRQVRIIADNIDWMLDTYGRLDAISVDRV